ncbi:hypothetical protein DL96DRAFT_1564592 [Flagelloscypha sp. PMI_526]|nr:hypothetical protein DL96DRAFT_1564592 [Flagelloscypha sp. PMI_526]
MGKQNGPKRRQPSTSDDQPRSPLEQAAETALDKDPVGKNKRTQQHSLLPTVITNDTYECGNQRENDRARAAKKAAANAKKPKESANSLAQRKERDADILREKQKKKEADKAAAASASGSGGGK